MNRNVDIHTEFTTRRIAQAGSDGDRLAIETPPLSSVGFSTCSSGEKGKSYVNKQLECSRLNNKEKKQGRKKKWKKPKGKPSRPLSAYNLFFQSQRSLMLGSDAPSKELESLKKRVHCKTHGKIGFADMARAIGAKWKSLDPENRKVFEDQALKEKQRYTKDLAAWKAQQKDERPSKGGKAGLHVIAAAAMASEPMETVTVGPAAQGADEVPTSFRMGVGGGRMLQLWEQRQQNNLEYLLALQDRQLGLSRIETSLLNYPSAAEASASALLQQFQGTALQVLTRRAYQPYDVDRLSQLATSSYSASHRTSLWRQP